MNADFFFKFAKFKFGSLVNAEDFSDKVNYQWTGSIIIISTAVIAMRQYIFTPIQCWVPPEWPRPWEEYTENYCWVQNTYAVAYMSKGFPDEAQRKKQELNYYQWVPFMLALEAMLVYVPHMLWKILAIRSGYNPNAIVKFAAEAATVDQAKKEKLTCYLAMQIAKAMKSRQKWKSDKAFECPSLCKSLLPCFWFGKRSGTMLFTLYITNKLVYIAVALGHLLLMKKFLGFDSWLYGFHCFQNLLRGKQWEQTNIFPMVTFCDVPAKNLGQWSVRSVQCVLPGNLLNDKIYIFLWFWTVFCIFLTVISTVAWLAKILIRKNSQHFVKKYLRILDVIARNSDEESDSEKEKRREFVEEFLNFDGIFLLQMIAENVGDMCVADIVKLMYEACTKTEIAENGQLPPGGRRASVVSQAGRRSSAMPLNDSDMFGKRSNV